MKKSTEIVLAWELFEQGLSKSAIARRLGRNRETIIIWIKQIEEQGLDSFLEVSTKACKVPRPTRQVDPVVKRWIWAIREREHKCCGQKIAYFLEKEHAVKVSVPKIYEVLAPGLQWFEGPNWSYPGKGGGVDPAWGQWSAGDGFP